MAQAKSLKKKTTKSASAKKRTVAKKVTASAKKAAALKKVPVRKAAAKSAADKRTQQAKTPTSKTQSATLFPDSGKALYENFEAFETNKAMEAMMPQSKVKFDVFAQEASNASREQMEILMKSGNIFFKGAEGVMQTWMSLAQKSAEKNSQALKSMMACKTLNELTEAQSKFAQQNFDEWMNSSAKISEQCVKVLTEALEPINDQFGKVVRKASEAAAA